MTIGQKFFETWCAAAGKLLCWQLLQPLERHAWELIAKDSSAAMAELGAPPAPVSPEEMLYNNWRVSMIAVGLPPSPWCDLGKTYRKGWEYFAQTVLSVPPKADGEGEPRL